MTIGQFWEDAIVPALVDYIRIPAKSPHFDKGWEKNGHIDAAVELAASWCRKHAVPGMALEVVRLPGRTPILDYAKRLTACVADVVAAHATPR